MQGIRANQLSPQVQCGYPKKWWLTAPASYAIIRISWYGG